MIGSLQLAPQASRSDATTVATSRSESRNLPEIRSTLVTWQPIQATLPKLLDADFTPLIDRPFVLLFEPDSNSRCRGQF